MPGAETLLPWRSNKVQSIGKLELMQRKQLSRSFWKYIQFLWFRMFMNAELNLIYMSVWKFISFYLRFWPDVKAQGFG